MTKVLVIGGDGYIGWPLSMRLASLGYDVTIMDKPDQAEMGNGNGSRTAV